MSATARNVDGKQRLQSVIPGGAAEAPAEGCPGLASPCWSFGSSPGSAQSPLCHQAELLASPEMTFLSMPAISTFLY